MYNYIKRQADYTLIISEYEKISIKDTPIQKVFNAALKKELTDFKSRERMTKKRLNFKSKIPIYINDKNLMMCIRSYRNAQCLYINYHAIFHYEHKQNNVFITFVDKTNLIIHEFYTFKQQLTKSKMVLDFIGKRKCFHIFK